MFVEEVKRTVTLEASEYCVARKSYLTHYEMDETASDTKVFQQRWWNVERQIINEITAAKRTAAQQQKQQSKQQKALELKSQRELNMTTRTKSRQRNKNNRNNNLKRRHQGNCRG